MPPKPPLRMPRQPIKTISPPKQSPKPTASKPRAFPQSAPQPSPRSAPRPTPQPTRPPPQWHTHFLTPRVLRQSASFGFFFFCAGLFVRDNLICKDTVNGSSMAPTLSPYAHETGVKDSIIIQRNVKWHGGVKRGDVVTFWKPHRPEEISIKRVVAVEGDVVYPWRGYALDPDIVSKDRVPGGWDGLGTRDEDVVGGGVVEVGKVTVPKGHVWVEGDNWRQSYDSLDFGPVSLGLVDGKAVRVWREWWRLNRVGDGRVEERRERTRVVKGEGRTPMHVELAV